MKPRIAIIGTGFSGICAAIRLQKAGFDDVILLEKAHDLGGTWRDNVYPGAACDTPAFSYCFSFEQKTDWSRKWAGQEQILGYLKHCATKYGLYSKIRFGFEVATAQWDDERTAWTIESKEGEKVEAQLLISAVGQLNRPSLPDLPGLDTFEGVGFHSARWRHDIDLAGKRVAVVGSAASAVQIVPELAKVAERLFVFQRSPNWIFPRLDREYSLKERRRFRRHPWWAKLYRTWIWLQHEMRFPIFTGSKGAVRRAEKLARQTLEQQVSDPTLREVLVPDYPIGGKRILITDDYYPALCRDNVELVTSGIERILPDGIQTSDGLHVAADVLVLATGFQTTAFLSPMDIRGTDGRRLNETWAFGANAYLGMTVSGFPNLFLMYGPNTNLGHNSIVFMIECQTRYIVDAIRQMAKRDIASIDVQPDVLQAYDDQLQRELDKTVWAKTDHSWYKNSEGRITNNWSGTTIRYWWRTRKANLDKYWARKRGVRATAG